MTRHLAIIAGILAIAPVAARAQSSSTTTQTTKGTTTGGDRADPRANPPSGYNSDKPASTGTDLQNARASGMHEGKRGDKTMTEDQVLHALHHIDQEEIKAGQMAEQKGSTQQVKDYGRMLVQDHQKADKQLMQVAQKMHVDLTNPKNLPQSMHEKSEVHQSKMQQLQRLNGKQFDQGFAQLMSNGHQEAIDMVKNAQANATGETKKLLDQLLPDLQKHKDVADQILSSSGNTASAK
jgi:putative membrane protein